MGEAAGAGPRGTSGDTWRHLALTLSAVGSSGGQEALGRLSGMCSLERSPCCFVERRLQREGWSQDQRKAGAAVLIQTRQGVPWTVERTPAGLEGGALFGGNAGGRLKREDFLIIRRGAEDVITTWG